MLNKEECEKALETLRILERKDNFKKWGGQVSPQINCDVVEQLIKEHFELVKKYDELYERHSKILDDVHDYRYETQSLKIIIRNLCKHFGVESEKELQNIYLNKPYTFEDLKPNMWLWDEKENKCNKIIEIEGKNIDFYYITESIDRFIVEFEEGRFFPVTKSMEHQK